MDYSHDVSGQQFFKLAQLFGAPEFVKKASQADLVGEDLAPELYADPVHGLFPCHTPAATWVNTAFFLAKKAELNPKDVPIIAERLQKYAEYHHITNAINALHKKAAETVKEADLGLTDDDFALVIGDDLEKQRYYRIMNGQEVKKAAEYLANNRDFMPFTLRREFADKVLQKVASMGVKLKPEVSDLLHRTAGFGACATKTAVDMLRDRVRASRKGPGALNTNQEELLKLANMIEAKPSKLHEPGIRVKTAEVVDAFDREFGLTRDYGKELLRPEDVLFELTTDKLASALTDHVANPNTGAIYRLADVEQLKLAAVRTYMGEDFADEITNTQGTIDSEKVAAIIPTLDRSYAALFDRMMADSGLAPVAKEASAERVGFSKGYLANMARDFQAKRFS